MSKALVIKGANFAANKVTTVELVEVVPCAGLTLSQSTITFTAIGETTQLTATKTPNDTTDTLTWQSSDTDVATVVDGLVTCIRIGTATITATCGTQSATCAVSSTVTVVLDDVYTAENGYDYSSSLDLNNGKDHIGRTSSSTSRLYWSPDNTTNGYRVFASTANAGKYAIPLPKGTKTITVDAPTGLKKTCKLALANTKEKQTYMGGADGESAKGLYANVNWNVPSWPRTIDISSYTSADGFILGVGGESGTDPSSVTGKTTVTFGYAAT